MDQIQKFRPNSDIKRKGALIFVEVLLYISIGCRVFASKLGVLNYVGLSGGIIAVCGLICFTIMMIKREPMPFSFVFMLIMNIFADISEFNVMNVQFFAGTGPKDMLYWLSWTLMACYVVRDEAAAMRFCFFLAFCVIMSVALGGKIYDMGDSTGLSRMTLQDVGTMFGNANALAQVAAVTAMALLYRSLRSSKVLMVGCTTVALVLAMVAVRTISRQGLILLVVGLLFYVSMIVIQKRGKLGFILLAFFCIFAANKFAEDTSVIMRGYEYRLQKDSTRTQYFGTMLQDMGDTAIFGKGSLKPFTVQGIQPHNTFLYLHVTYGGLCAWTYVLWTLLITWNTCKFIWRDKGQMERRIEVLAFLVLFLLPQPVNVFAPGNFGNMLALVTMEKSLIE